jgi:hypothetical protein
MMADAIAFTPKVKDVNWKTVLDIDYEGLMSVRYK